MTQITDPLIFSGTCPIGDGSGNFKYCGPCPSLTVVGATQQKICAMQGWAEFKGFVSNPPVFYTQYTVDWGGLTMTYTNDVSGTADYTLAYTGNGTVNYGSPASDTKEERTGNTPGTSYFSLADMLSASPPSALGISNGDPDDLLGMSPFTPTAHVNIVSATEFDYDDTSGSYSSGVQHWATGGGPVKITLSTPDTDIAALARATEVDGTTSSGDPTTNYGFGTPNSGALFSLYETRQNVPANYPALCQGFTYQTAQFAIFLTNLLWGGATTYSLVVKFEQRTAAGDGSGNDSLYGAWTYLSGHDVSLTVTPTADNWDNSASPISIPFAAGYQCRIKSIALKPCWA